MLWKAASSRSRPSRGADDEGTGTDFESGNGEAEVVGAGRDYGRDGSHDAGAWGERLNEHGYSGLWDYRKRSPVPNEFR